MKTPYILCFSHIGYEFFTILKSKAFITYMKSTKSPKDFPIRINAKT